MGTGGIDVDRGRDEATIRARAARQDLGGLEDVMLTLDRTMQIMQESLTSLRSAGLLDVDIAVTGDTVLLGAGSQLDSIALVTFVTEMEDRLNRETGQELYLILTDLHDFNPETAKLSADTLARYVVKLAQS